jgi:hypothetical protein
MQSKRDKTTLGIGVLLVATAMIGKAFPLLSVPLVGLALFFIAWGRDQLRVEAFVGRLPAASYLLKILNHLDLIISPRENQRAKKMLHKCYMEICDLFQETVSQLDVSKYVERVYETLTNQANCIEKELGTIAKVKFLNHIGINNAIFRGVGGNAEYNNILRILERTKDNLEELIKSENWNEIK